MNEKFKLLALEAKMGTADFDAGSYYVATPDKMQRFAELIVRECLSIVDDAERGGSNEVWDNAVEFIRRDLKEHFGVEQ